MQLVLKIILLVVIASVALFLSGLIFFFIVIQEQKFEFEMLYIIGVSLLGFLSSWFHIKTIKLYRLDKLNQVLPVPSKIFWTLNIGFAGALVSLFAWVFYMVFIRFEGNQSANSSQFITGAIIVFSIPILIGGFIFFESYYIKQMLKKNKDRKLILEIDTIKGTDND